MISVDAFVTRQELCSFKVAPSQLGQRAVCDLTKSDGLIIEADVRQCLARRR